METPEEHAREEERLELLKTYSVMDSLPETDYDNLTRLAAEICGTPISLITLLDDKRQWFKSNHGLPVRETPKEYAFCAHAIVGKDDTFVVGDATKDERFHDNPLVIDDPRVIFYAGVPFSTGSGLPLGTLCVIDHVPRKLEQGQIDALKILSGQVTRLLELRKSKMELEYANNELQRKNDELEKFADTAAHDLKAPLSNIVALTVGLRSGYSEKLDGKGKKILKMIETSSDTLRRLIDGLLDHAKSVGGDLRSREKILLTELVDTIKVLFSGQGRPKITLQSELRHIYVNRSAIERILSNLVANSINYNDRETTEIDIHVTGEVSHYRFSFEDNGPGIALEHREKVFGLFETLAIRDRFGRSGTGIGLATVRRTIEKLGGEISIEHQVDRGTRFVFTLAK